MKSAEKKTKQTLKEVAAISNINKARKVFWFEKFFWFISSENYLVIAGRDMQQNELIVKKYMRPGDIYVHADLHGASSIVVKNPSGNPVPPKTLNEAGQLATCYSVAWENKVVVSAWWVESSQVSKTAPSGEYLTAGSFMIRGKKNYLPPSHLILGFGFLFKLEESSIERHKDERRVRDLGSEISVDESIASNDQEDVEIEIDENASSGDERDDLAEKVEEVKLDKITEEVDEVQEKADNEDASSSDDDDGESAFPDTAIDIKVTKSGEVKVKARGQSESSDKRPDENEEQMITFSNQPRKKQTQNQPKKKGKNVEAEKKEEAESKGNQQKRGKKGKMKKIKEKYRDQDEEDKEMMMKVLQGSQREKKKDKKMAAKQSEEDLKTKRKTGNKPREPRQQQQQNDVEVEDDEKLPNVNAEVDMIDSLTGIKCRIFILLSFNLCF